METLADWVEAYLKHRDLFERKIATIEKKEGEILITNKDGTVTHCPLVELLDDRILGKLSDTKTLLVTKNLKENLSFLTEHWDAFAKRLQLKLVFVNLTANEKWVLVPSSHARIADPESLEQGLQAMFRAIPEG